MRNQLETEIMNTLFKYRNSIPFEDIKAQLTIILSEYEIDKRNTEIALEDGKNDVINESEKKHNSDLDYKDGLEDGRMEAWECARKIYKMTAKEVIAVFGGCSNWVDYSVDEAIAKIKEYEQKQTDEMSLSDAINWMKDYFRTTDMPMPQYEKAFEMAIKSMEYIDDHAL